MTSDGLGLADGRRGLQDACLGLVDPGTRLVELWRGCAAQDAVVVALCGIQGQSGLLQRQRLRHGSYISPAGHLVIVRLGYVYRNLRLLIADGRRLDLFGTRALLQIGERRNGLVAARLGGLQPGFRLRQLPFGRGDAAFSRNHRLSVRLRALVAGRPP